jgi:tRNA(Ile)-lysidine synthetase-like protein
LRGDRYGIMATHVEQVIHLASESESGRRVELPGGIVVERNFGELVFSRMGHLASKGRAAETDSQSGTYLYLVNLPADGDVTVSIPELRSRVCLKVIDWPIAERDTKREPTALDADLLLSPLVLRNWRPGDSYRPRGHRRSQKLKKMFLAGRIPSYDRGLWPVLESRGQVVWARGMPPADEYCARAGTRAGVLIEEDRF